MHKIKEKISMKKLKRVLALAMAVILSVPTLSTGTGSIPVKAADDSIELVVSNESAKYAGYETHKMSVGAIMHTAYSRLKRHQNQEHILNITM